MNPSITSVLGEVPWKNIGVADAHNHVWIEPTPGCIPDAPILNQKEQILVELIEYRQAGGNAILDCQPGGCGRNGSVLASLSMDSGVSIIACTGFHRPIYYGPNYWIWNSTADQVTDHLMAEINTGLEETLGSEIIIKAGFIKIGCEDILGKTYQPALLGAAQAAKISGKMIEVHTEKGQAAADILNFLLISGVAPSQIVLCHMDKRPDYGLHRELAQSGVALEYDTFYRVKYQPEQFLWPLILTMVEAGYGGHICLATDIAEASYWKHLGGGPGLANFPTQIRKRLLNLGLNNQIVNNLIGGNICRILANVQV
jgi:5-phospho-D-xylono-1,4-lactonase